MSIDTTIHGECRRIARELSEALGGAPFEVRGPNGGYLSLERSGQVLCMTLPPPLLLSWLRAFEAGVVIGFREGSQDERNKRLEEGGVGINLLIDGQEVGRRVLDAFDQNSPRVSPDD